MIPALPRLFPEGEKAYDHQKGRHARKKHDSGLLPAHCSSVPVSGSMQQDRPKLIINDALASHGVASNLVFTASFPMEKRSYEYLTTLVPSLSLDEIVKKIRLVLRVFINKRA